MTRASSCRWAGWGKRRLTTLPLKEPVSNGSDNQGSDASGGWGNSGGDSCIGHSSSTVDNVQL